MVHIKNTLHDRRYLIPIRYVIVKKLGARHFYGRSFSWSNFKKEMGAPISLADVSFLHMYYAT